MEVLAWQEREATKELLRADPGNANFRKSLKTAQKRLKGVGILRGIRQST